MIEDLRLCVSGFGIVSAKAEGLDLPDLDEREGEILEKPEQEASVK